MVVMTRVVVVVIAVGLRIRGSGGVGTGWCTVLMLKQRGGVWAGVRCERGCGLGGAERKVCVCVCACT